MLEGRMMRLHLCLGASSAAVWGLPGRGWWEDCESCRKLLLAFGQISKEVLDQSHMELERRAFG